MGKNPAFQFYPGDVRRDAEYHMMSFEARGVWWEMLCCMWDAKERGKLEGTIDQLSLLLGSNANITQAAIAEISVTKSGNVTERNGIITIINRRMYREDKTRLQARKRATKYRSRKSESRTDNGDITAPSSSSSSLEKEKEKDFIRNAEKPMRANGKRSAQDAIAEIKRLIKFKEWDPQKSIHCLCFNREHMIDDPVRDQVLQEDPCPNDNYQRQQWFGRFEQKYTEISGGAE